MLTRRQFQARLLSAIAAASLPLAHGARAEGDSALLSGGDDLWLNRLTFGATPVARAELAALGREGWLDRQLALTAAEDTGLADRLAAARLRIAYEAGSDEDGNSWVALDELRPLGTLSADPADLVALGEWGPGKGMDYSERSRPAQEVIAASLIRAVHAKAQLREVMTQFWHDHFNVNSAKDEFTALSFPAYDALLRTHALGNFRTVLGEVARAPAMLYYLNNADSIASPANENFARELLELHTLGAGNYLNDRYRNWKDVPGAQDGLAQGYLDLDVYEVARAFTGWSVGDSRWIAEGEDAPRTGRFHYVARWHDPYQKRILGREFAPNRGPMADGDEVLDILARHPGTAAFVCEKLARRLLSDDPPPDLVARLAERFLAAADAPDQIAQVLRLLVLDPAFQAPPAKIRRPFELLAAYYRATGSDVRGVENGFHWQLIRAGWRQHEYGPPTGHPDRLSAWTGPSTVNRMVDMLLYAHDDWFDGASADLTAPLDATETVLAFLSRHAAALVPSRADEAARATIDAFGLSADDPVADFAAEDRQSGARVAIAFAALTPEFLLR